MENRVDNGLMTKQIAELAPLTGETSSGTIPAQHQISQHSINKSSKKESWCWRARAVTGRAADRRRPGGFSSLAGLPAAVAVAQIRLRT